MSRQDSNLAGEILSTFFQCLIFNASVGMLSIHALLVNAPHTSVRKIPVAQVAVNVLTCTGDSRATSPSKVKAIT